MARTTNTVETIFEGEDRTSDDIRRIQRNLGDLEDQTNSFTKLITGPVGMIAAMYLTQEALQRTIEGMHALAMEMDTPEAEQYRTQVDDLRETFRDLGEAILTSSLPAINSFLEGLNDVLDVAVRLSNLSPSGVLKWLIFAQAPGMRELAGADPTIGEALAGIEPGNVLGSIEGQEGVTGLIEPGANPLEQVQMLIEKHFELRQLIAETTEGQVAGMAARIEGDLVPAFELVGVAGAESLELVTLSAEEADVALVNTAIDAAQAYDEYLLPVLDQVIDRLFEGSDAASIFGSALQAAVGGFMTMGPLGAALGAGGAIAAGVINRTRGDDVPRA